MSGLVAVFSADAVMNLFTDVLKKASDKFFGTTVSIYDKAIDKAGVVKYGVYHRLFDGGHDVVSAWNRVERVSAGDGMGQEIAGYTSALVKDFVTKMGIPIVTISRKSFNSIAEKMSVIPGVDKSYIYKLLSINGAKLISSVLTLTVYIFGLKKKDAGEISEILGSMSICSIVAANPLLGVFTIISAVFAYRKKQIRSSDVLKGGAVSVIIFYIISVLGLPFLIKLIIAVYVSGCIKNKVLDKIDIKKLIAYLVNNREVVKNA